MTDHIERQLDLPAPPGTVWRFLLDPGLLSQWLADETQLELRPGGDAWFRIGEEERAGWVEEIRAPETEHGEAGLVFWWRPAGADDSASRVEVTLTPQPEGGTRLRVVETRPLEVLDLVGFPLSGAGGASHGPALIAA